MTMIDRRHIEALVAIADVGTITGAAQQLHVSQPTLSRTLGQLEELVGVRLVDRSTHHLELTESGARFLVDARLALASIDAAVAVARDTVRPLRLGYSWATNERIATILAAWERAEPDVPVVATYTEATAAGLAEGTFDVVVARDPQDARRERWITLDSEERWAAVPRRHRFARRKELRLADLTDETIVVSTHGTTRLTMWPEDARPTHTVATGSTDEWLVEVATGHGIGVTVGSTVRSRPHPDVVYVRVVDAPPVDLRLVTRRRPAHPYARRFLDVAADA
jgi:DNA-binding transcriptional LysR family regulator